MKFKFKEDKLLKQKKMYLYLIFIMIIGFIIGIIFPFILDSESLDTLKISVTSFFNNISNNNINYNTGIFNALITNTLYVIGIWLLGISIIGSIIVILNLLFQSFSFGFAIASIIKIYGIKGLIGSIVYCFPGELLSLIITLLLTFYSFSFTIKLFKYLFLKENLNFKLIMNKYVKILFISLTSYIIISILDVYLSPFLMKLFTLLL